MNNNQNQSVATSVADNIIVKNVLAWQAAKQEAARHARAAREAREFRAGFGRVQFSLPKGFALAR